VKKGSTMRNPKIATVIAKNYSPAVADTIRRIIVGYAAWN